MLTDSISHPYIYIACNYRYYIQFNTFLISGFKVDVLSHLILSEASHPFIQAPINLHTSTQMPHGHCKPKGRDHVSSTAPSPRKLLCHPLGVQARSFLRTLSPTHAHPVDHHVLQVSLYHSPQSLSYTCLNHRDRLHTGLSDPHWSHPQGSINTPL